MTVHSRLVVKTCGRMQHTADRDLAALLRATAASPRHRDKGTTTLADQGRKLLVRRPQCSLGSINRPCDLSSAARPETGQGRSINADRLPKQAQLDLAADDITQR